MADGPPDTNAHLVRIDPSTQIRVLVLDPGDLGHWLTGHFEIVTFHGDELRPEEGSIEWEAVSYTWGGQEPIIGIQVDENQVLVTPNVEAILFDLRYPTRPRYLWIDGICINQSNEEEKRYQIAIMLKVYHYAKSVVVWLQEQRDELRTCAAAVKWLEEIHLNDSFYLSLNRERPIRAFFYEDLKRRGVSSSQLRPFMLLLANDWFGRAWVFQEACVARNLLVYMAGNLIPWDRLVNAALRFLCDSIYADYAVSNSLTDCYRACLYVCETGAPHLGLTMIYGIHRIRRLRASSAPMVPPSLVIAMVAGRKVKNKADMIFSLNGLFQWWNVQFPSIVDYTLSPIEVFIRFTIHCIQHEGNLDILAQLRRGCSSYDNVPGWVRDWTQPQVPSILEPPAEDALFGSARRPIPSNYPPSYARDGQTLVVRGYIVDELVGAILPEYLTMNRFELADTEANRLPRFWRDGDTPYTNQGIWSQLYPRKTRNGRIAFSSSHLPESELLLVCCLFGARHPMLLTSNEDRSRYHIMYSICIMDGFEDGHGIEVAQSMGLEVTTFCIV